MLTHLKKKNQLIKFQNGLDSEVKRLATRIRVGRKSRGKSKSLLYENQQAMWGKGILGDDNYNPQSLSNTKVYYYYSALQCPALKVQ